MVIACLPLSPNPLNAGPPSEFIPHLLVDHHTLDLDCCDRRLNIMHPLLILTISLWYIIASCDHVHGFQSSIINPIANGRWRADQINDVISLQDIMSNCAEIMNSESLTDNNQRRMVIQQLSATTASFLVLLSPNSASSIVVTSEPYIRSPSLKDKFQFGYTVTPPPTFISSNKPLKTHLDEINFSPPDVRGYALGITVDPVRISSIREFGSPEEVAARVVTAEVNRDGVFEVTLAKDPREYTSGGVGCYDIEYISDGKRGKKRYVTRIYIKDGFLYVLTVQSKEDEFDKAREVEVMECVKSFRPI